MFDQANTAASRLMGQDTSNVSLALRKASDDLGGKFDRFLRGNSVKIDRQFLQDATDVLNKAQAELSDDTVKPVLNQFNEILKKGAAGEIEGQAAYNIKRTLDRIGAGNTPAAYHARQLRMSLMSALERSVGPEKASEFAALRRQYGNMNALENIAQNGAEGGVSIGKLANMKNINNADLQELADISAQFLRSRESNHSSMQRLMLGGLGAATAGPQYVAGMGAVGRAANATLNSNALRAALRGESVDLAIVRLLSNESLAPIVYRAPSVVAADR